MHALLRVIRKNRVVLYDRISILFVDKILRKQTWKKLGRRSRKSIFLNYDTKCDTIIVTWHVRAVFILTISFFCVTCTSWPYADLPCMDTCYGALDIIGVLESNDEQFLSASFDVCDNFARGCPPTHLPTQIFWKWFPTWKSHGMMVILVSFWWALKALQTQICRFKIHSLG